MKKSDKPWAGRFAQKTKKSVEKFTESVSYDWRLAPYDVRASRAHAEGLRRAGIISKSEHQRIDRSLREILDEIVNGKFRILMELEDVHMNIEHRLKEKIGDLAGKLHTARSRNDLVSADLRLYLKDATTSVKRGITLMQKTIVKKAEDNIGVLMPGYTHLQRAQPVLFAHHLMAYYEMLARDYGRLTDAARRGDVCPLGSCALAGSALPVDWEAEARALGFAATTRNSIDAVSDRDFVIEFFAAAAVLMVHLSRFAEEIVLWSSQEFGFITLPDEACTGSSIMPHKKNPDVAELIRSKTGRVAGALIAMIITMKGLPLSYNRDLQEDKENVFDAVDTVMSCLEMASELIGGARINADVMEQAADGDFTASVDLTDYLVLKGIPFRTAHQIAGKIVKTLEKSGKSLKNITLGELRKFSSVFEEDVFSYLTVRGSIKRKVGSFSTAPGEVRKSIRRARRELEKRQ
ncbi:MAG: argininosuccinate lyase [bacterium]